MPSKRYNIWMKTTLISRIKKAAKSTGVKVSTYIRMAVLEKLDDIRHVKTKETTY